MKKKVFLFGIGWIAMLFAAAQHVGIGTTTPKARLHIADSAVLFSGGISVPPLTTTINPPVQGTGTRMFWFPALGAFRAGYVAGVQWDRDSIGQLSFAAGYNTKANGRLSVAFGNNSNAAGDESFAVGNSTAMGAFSTAFGRSTASGNFSTSLGQNSTASGSSSVSLGSYTTASGLASTSMGSSSVASGQYSTATGGNSTAIGHYSFSAGEETFAKARGSFTTGLWNDNTDNPNNNTTASTDRIFQIGNGNLVTRSNALTVLRNGFIGLSNILPHAQLQFSNNEDFRKMVMYEMADNINQFIGLGYYDNEFVYQIPSTTHDHVFYTGTGPASSRPLLRIKGNGNVGVGPVDPEYRLDVDGRVRIRSGGDLFSSAGTWLNNIDNTSSPAFVGMESDDGVGFYGNTTPNGWGFVMKIGTGNVGIGTSSPAAKLHVAGSILATGSITPSDLRYKNNVRPISNALSKLQLLNGVTYRMNTTTFPEWQFDTTMQYGLIAQDVEKVFPELVKKIDAKGYKGLDYVKLVPILIEAIKEQQQQINELKKLLLLTSEKIK